MTLPVDQAFVLNLDRRPGRWQTVLTRLAKQGVLPQRFSAVDGEEFSFLKTHWNEPARSKFRTPGALACMLSHIRMLECAQLNGYRRIAVFEDDVRPHLRLSTLTPQLESLPDWHVVYLGATQIDWTTVRDGPPGFYRPSRTLGTWAMLIDERAYPRMLEAYRNFRASADLTLSALFEHDDTVYVASPNWCICDVTSSDIRRTSLSHLPAICRWQVEDYEP